MMRRQLLLLLLHSFLIQSSSAWVISSSQRSAQQRSFQLAETTSSGTTSTEPASATQETRKRGVTLDGIEIRQDITAVNNILVVRVKETLVATGGGILLPDQSKERPTEGLVLAAGPGKLHPHTGIRIDNPISAGMSVLYGKFDGTAMEYNGEECQIIRDDNVLLQYEGVTLRFENAIPVRDYVLVELPESEAQAKTESGIMLAGQVTRDQLPCEGTVVKVGEGRMSAKGELTKSPVKVGDRIKFKDYAGNDILIEGKKYSVVKMVDILASYVGEKKL